MQDAPREGFRLSPQQKYLWTLQQASSDQPYRVIGSLLIEGDVDSAALKECVAKVVGRHEILRTAFVRPPGIRTPFQVVSEDLRFSWSEADLSAMHSAEQQTQVEHFFAEARKRPIDLEYGPLLCVCCLRLADNQHLLIVMLPALCGDRITFRNLACEISKGYGSEQTQQSIQYADFAEWQNELLASEDKTAAQAGAFWKQQQELATKPALVLPFENRLQKSAAFEPHSVGFDIGDDLPGKLETLAQRYQTSVSVVLFACWQALLWRLTNESDFVVWSLNDGRKFEDLRSAMGLYARYLPVFCPGADRTFAEYLNHSQHEFAQTGEWQEYFDPGPEKDHTPHEDIAFEFQARLTHKKGIELSFLVGREFVCTRPFKIKLQVLSNGTSLLSTFEYNSKVFDRVSVDRIIGYYKRLLAKVIQRPDAAIGAMSILNADERRRLLFESNQTNAAYPDRCIHELFEEQASKTPGSPAVVCQDKVLTYSELDKRANQLARVLQRRGVGPETPVALCMSRSVEAIVGLLAILKAGGAYVPLNPDHPKARLENQLAQSQATICLVNDSRIGPFVDVIELNHDWSLLDNESDTNPGTTTTSQNLVYVIFTSGSAGVPKGVAVRHRNLVNYTHYILDRLAIKAPLNFATVSTITADLGNTCIFPSLVSGGCLHVLNDETALEGNLFAKYIFDNSIDVLKIVPSHLKALLASTDKNILPAKYLLLGGESLSWDLIKRLSRLEHTCKIINHYGPTETTVGSLTFDVDEEYISPYSLTVPIGRPIANTRIYLLDKYLMPVPQGVTGELFIGGAGVADGYKNQPAETAARFLPDPSSSNVGARLYRSGDLARQLPDGNFEFISRVDRQVKTRGYRVELAEIEKTIEEQPGVVQAVVVARGDKDENQQLVAYLTVSGVKPPRHDDIRLALTQTLPSYMVPSAFVFLDSFPLTANGKLNRAALPAPEQSRPELRKVFVPPRTASEKKIAAIWASVLKLDEVGIHDDFFELGGHSLLATQVVARVRKAFRFDIPLRSLFESPTISLLAERIDRATEAEMAELLTALEALSDEEAQKVLAMEKARQSRKKS